MYHSNLPQVCVTRADGGIKRVQIAGAVGSGGAGGTARGQQKVQVAVSGAALHPVTAIQVRLAVWFTLKIKMNKSYVVISFLKVKVYSN